MSDTTVVAVFVAVVATFFLSYIAFGAPDSFMDCVVWNTPGAPCR